MLAPLFAAIRANPLLLRQEHPEMVRKLKTQAVNKNAQGTGNKVTDQEASFAALLEAHGFVFQPKANTKAKKPKKAKKAKKPKKAKKAKNATAAEIEAAEAAAAAEAEAAAAAAEAEAAAAAAAAEEAEAVATAAAPGKYYNYQVNGSQRSIDFRVFEYDGTAVTRQIDLDLKHTLDDVFFLNDGWFHKDVVYIVTWDRRTSALRKKKTTEPATLIALGQDIPSPEESAYMDELLTVKKKNNTEFKGCGSLSTYIRFANRYKCDRFTPEETERLYGRIAV